MQVSKKSIEYYEENIAVRTLMADTVLDLNELEQWHTAAQPIADPLFADRNTVHDGLFGTLRGIC